jgi:tetratricopeptide (TPR) repeat protein
MTSLCRVSAEVLTVTKRTTKSNVFLIRRASTGADKASDQLRLAQKKVSEARAEEGKKRVALAKEALDIFPDCAEAHSLIAEETQERPARIKQYRKAIAAAEKTLGDEWERRYKGSFWLASETRPLMHAMAMLAIDLQWEDQIEEALEIYRKLLDWNPTDHQGVHYQFAACLLEANRPEELERHLAKYEDEASAVLSYTKALHLFRKYGPSDKTNQSLIKAFQVNIHVPIYLSEVVSLPEIAPSTIGFGDEREAEAYVMDCGYLWADIDGAEKWMADVLAPELEKSYPDEELAAKAIKKLKKGTKA